MDKCWWKDAVIYAVDVERFFDSDGDGIGDFKGLASKLGYISDLGVTCIWLMPFYPSSGRDNGYDITDYLRVDTRFGLFEDFLEFVHRAGEYGIRIVVDLVVHHTSTQHPWFQAGRHNESSSYRDYYVWTHNPPPTPPGKGTIFPGEEETVWTYDDVARAYYHHRFYHFEPGLNHANPEVRAEIIRIVDYWLSFGVAGFRVDAASHIEEDPLSKTGKEQTSPDVLREIYDRASGFKSDVVLLGEVDETPEKLEKFFDGTRLDMMFNFLLNCHMMLSLASETAEPLQRGLALQPVPPPNGQWANFLRNFDEADLERLSPQELEFVLDRFAPDERMRIYDRGIRRRLAPMLGGDPRRIKMAMSLLFSMPGAPLVVYGDEIGMGEDLSQDGRNSVRSPMQWTGGHNAGFSSAQKNKLVQAVIEDGPFGYGKVNVEAQTQDKDSLLSFVKKLVKIRRQRIEIGSGFCAFLESGSDHVLAHHYKSEFAPLVLLHNLKGDEAEVNVPLPPGATRLAALVGDEPPAVENGRLRLTLEPYGLRWFGLPHEGG
ncbi:alpha-amylase family protein [Chelativorans sp. AA-79]|uniref:alpha-amylase family protein n=1 Tax=Chelativorans sp. AA-79 TaxID=3028735 RepID=UPI0023F6C54B|nr:alpha-amylase family protein [Chelativorans sp. AA-79]WEX09536.1 alpha-amylase family protein [Chelativorans sp. AA-79]